MATIGIIGSIPPYRRPVGAKSKRAYRRWRYVNDDVAMVAAHALGQAIIGQQVLLHDRRCKHVACADIDAFAEHALQLHHVRMEDMPGRDGAHARL